MHKFINAPGTILGYRKNGMPIYPIAGGSEPIAEAPEPVATPDPPVADYATPEPKDNPAWTPFFEALPDSLHNQIRPVLSEWDRNVQARIQQVQQQYDPWKPFIENQVDPEMANYALQVLNTINETPQDFIAAVAEHFQLTPQQLFPDFAPTTEPSPFEVQGDPQSQEAPIDPRIAQLEEGYRALAAITLQQHAAEEALQADQQVTSMLEYAKDKYGDFDETAVLNNMLGNGGDIDAAVAQYQEMADRILQQNQRPAPRVLGGGGSGVPTTPVNATTMTEAERKAFVVKALMEANNQ